MSAGVRSHGLTVAVGVGSALVFAGERLVQVGNGRLGATGLGLALVGLATAARALRVARGAGDRRAVEAVLLGLQGTVLAGLLLGVWLTGARAVDWPRWTVVASALVPLLVSVGGWPLLLGELSYASTPAEAEVEGGRVMDAVYSGLGLAFLLVFAFSAYFVASERDVRVDLSRFRVAKPGEATRKVAQALEEPVTVVTFFPPANDVAQAVHDYVSALQAEGPNLKLEKRDVAVDPARARELGVSGNGAVLLSAGGRKEQFLLGTDLERARGDLRRLDEDFQKRLLAVSRPRKVVYVTAGHGERGEDRGGTTDQRPTARLLRKMVEALNHAVKPLGTAEGLGSEVPADAAAVLVVGPRQALLPEEAGALGRYVQRGGRVLYALEPGVEAAGLLGPLGLTLTAHLLANDVAYLQRTNQVSDRAGIATSTYSSHPSVTTLSQLGRRAPMVLLEAGAVQPQKALPAGVSVDVTVRAHPQTWLDADGDYAFTKDAEERKGWELAAAVKVGGGGKDVPEGRALVVGDADAVSDLLLQNEPNLLFASDGLKWLLGEEQLAGSVSNEEDVALQHTRSKGVAWFYSTLFGAPGLVLLGGYLYVRRRGGRREARP
ncbi:MAG: Gldg family protein [Deltaproteobacteria bacterium]|nr:Gldg family protein [Deltaproteobacteria bacterium]